MQGRTEASQAKPLTQSTTAYLHRSNIIGLQGNIIDLVYTSYTMVYIMLLGLLYSTWLLLVNFLLLLLLTIIFCSLKPVYCDGPILFKAITIVDLCKQCRQLQG